MQPQRTPAAKSGIAVAHGYGLKLYVAERGHLIVHDGIGRDRRTRRYHRATSKLKRLVLIGHTGYLTLDALRWLRDVGAALVHIDADGQVVTTSTARGPDLAPLRRAQALAPMTSAGVEVARDLLRSKVEGQAALLVELPGGQQAQPELESALRAIAEASALPALLRAEALAANAYWTAWADLPVRLGGGNAVKVPDHWRSFGQRHSPLTNSPRVAANPANAILNYLYALLEAETIIACHHVGLDPGLGIFHTDRRDRASLALDVMEAVRPIVDGYVLALITQRTLARSDFAETRQGACRITPRLATRLADTLEGWRAQVEPVVERTAQMLEAALGQGGDLATRLTRANARAAWDTRAPHRRRRERRGQVPALPASCRDCGAELPNRRKRYCDECRRRRFDEQASGARRTAAETLARLRAGQVDPAHGGRAAETRGRKNAAHQRAVREWRGGQADPCMFLAEIQPSLRSLSITELVAATGLSEHYCSLIRLGKRVPHARHWETLRRLARAR